MAEMHILGQVWPIFGQNPYFLGREQKFVHTHFRKPPRHLVCVVVWSGIALNGPKRPKIGNNFGPNLPVLGLKIHFLGEGAIFLVPSY